MIDDVEWDLFAFVGHSPLLGAKVRGEPVEWKYAPGRYAGGSGGGAEGIATRAARAPGLRTSCGCMGWGGTGGTGGGTECASGLCPLGFWL